MSARSRISMAPHRHLRSLAPVLRWAVYEAGKTHARDDALTRVYPFAARSYSPGAQAPGQA